MTAYYVYWNRIRRRVRVHRAECSACRYGKGMHLGKIAAGRGDTYDWVAANDYGHALSLARGHAARLGAEVIDCGLCNPQRSN
ncbi:MAG TPA: hypothetical protein VN802_06600 [Stellaceae bacterium]|nr:hypothetical protein [Stellaceae bacterium]